jgi:DNA-binding GntR family transcriptional regulator
LEQISARQIVVRQLELSEVREIFEIREMLEARAASLATERITTDQYNSLEQLHLAMKTTASKGEFSDYFDLNIAFHTLIHEIASAPRLAALIDQVMRESLLFRSRGLVDEKNIRSSIEEHEQLLKALRAGDGELASLLMSRHIQGGFNRLELI